MVHHRFRILNWMFVQFVSIGARALRRPSAVGVRPESRFARAALDPIAPHTFILTQIRKLFSYNYDVTAPY